jgi:hypothetical protein
MEDEFGITKEEKLFVLNAERQAAQREIYRFTVMAAVRKSAGYTEAEIKPLLDEAEKLTRLRDGLTEKIQAL